MCNKCVFSFTHTRGILGNSGAYDSNWNKVTNIIFPPHLQRENRARFKCKLCIAFSGIKTSFRVQLKSQFQHFGSIKKRGESKVSDRWVVWKIWRISTGTSWPSCRAGTNSPCFLSLILLQSPGPRRKRTSVLWVALPGYMSIVDKVAVHPHWVLHWNNRQEKKKKR